MATAALVFGREDRGLANGGLCDLLTGFPMAVSYPSLNLSQAVALYAWELSGLARQMTTRRRSPQTPAGRLAATPGSTVTGAGGTGRQPCRNGCSSACPALRTGRRLCTLWRQPRTPTLSLLLEPSGPERIQRHRRLLTVDDLGNHRGAARRRSMKVPWPVFRNRFRRGPRPMMAGPSGVMGRKPVRVSAASGSAQPGKREHGFLDSGDARLRNVAIEVRQLGKARGPEPVADQVDTAFRLSSWIVLAGALSGSLRALSGCNP